MKKNRWLILIVFLFLVLLASYASADEAIDCGFLEFGEIEPIANEVLIEDRTDCDILNEKEVLDEYLEDVVQMEENCFERAQELNQNLEDMAERLQREIEEQNELPEPEDNRSPTEEYADTLVEIVTAQSKIMSDFGDESIRAIEELRAFQYSGREHESHLEESAHFIKKKALNSCRKAVEIIEGLKRICAFTNAKIIDDGGLTENEKRGTLSMIESELGKAEERFAKVQELHSEFERKGSDIEDWYASAAFGIEETFARIKEYCDELEVIKLMAQIYGGELNNTLFLERYGNAKKKIEEKALAGILATLFGNERANLFIINESGGKIKMHFVTENKQIRKFGVSSVEEATVNVNMDIDTMRNIIDSGDPAVYFAEGIKNDKVNYSGIGFGKKIKFGVIGFFGNLFGF